MPGTSKTSIGLAIAFALGTVLSSGAALADKGGKGHDGGGKGHGGGKSHDRGEQRDDRESHGKRDGHQRDHVERFGDPHRSYVRDYYATQYREGRCPPGLAKKHNGCMPPGQSKKWHTGQPLPRDVRYYEVPQPLVLQLGQPAPGYRYVRVDDNILLLATGTRMVVDSIRALGR
jgi:Ni/Co efflux regulator RcnB